MKKRVIAFAACMAIATFAPAAQAMTLGALTRQSPVAAAELVAVAEPAVCRDIACGTGSSKASGIAPVIHIIFASFGQFLGTAERQIASAAASAG